VRGYLWSLTIGAGFVTILLGYSAWRSLSPEHQLIAAGRIVFADSSPDHPKNFDLAIRNLKAIPQDSWAHELVPGYLSVIEAQRDRPENFQSFTPEQHYAAAIYICQRPPRRADEFEPVAHECLLRSPEDFSRVIRHLEAVPRDSRIYEDAARTLRPVEIQRDHPQDFEAAKGRYFQQCVADAEAQFHGKDVCGNAIYEGCDLFGVTRSANRVIAATPKPSAENSAMKAHRWAEGEILERVKAAAKP
jgi:hypothetical protein